jgi:Resolvase, N terminal domain
MRVVGYGRCSTAEQARDGVSIEVQRRAVQILADSNGWEMAWLADEGVSGAVSPEERADSNNHHGRSDPTSAPQRNRSPAASRRRLDATKTNALRAPARR